MSESRIQDWIRYVQERAENVLEDAADDATGDAPPSIAPPVGKTPVAPSNTAPAVAVQKGEERDAPLQTPPLSGPAETGGTAAGGTAAGGTAARRAKRLLPRGITIPSTEARSAVQPVVSQPAAAAQNTRTALVSTQVAPPNDTSPTHALDMSSAPGSAREPGNHTGSAKAQHTGQRQRQRPETRAQMLERLTNPTISLHETSVLLGVCSATVRRYTNSGLLPHARTEGGQRRFRLREVLLLMRELEAKRKS